MDVLVFLSYSESPSDYSRLCHDGHILRETNGGESFWVCFATGWLRASRRCEHLDFRTTLTGVAISVLAGVTTPQMLCDVPVVKRLTAAIIGIPIGGHALHFLHTSSGWCLTTDLAMLGAKWWSGVVPDWSYCHIYCQLNAVLVESLVDCT